MMRAPLFTALAAIAAAAAEPDRGFATWFSTELRTAKERELEVQGSIPAYVRGTFLQSGPGRFDMGDMSFGHALDGFSKPLELRFEGDEGNAKVTFSTDFLQSNFYKQSLEQNKIVPGMTAAETKPASRSGYAMLNALGPNDNNYIKPRFIGQTEVMTSDTNYLTVMGDPLHANYTICPTLPGSLMQSHWVDVPMLPLGHICIQAAMAHGTPDPQTGGYVTTMGCQTANVWPLEHYHVIFRIDPSDIHRRVRIAKVPLPSGRRPSYMHMNGETERYHVLVATPFYMDLEAVMLGKGLAEGGLTSPPGEQTLFQIVNKSEPSLVRQVATPGFLTGHVVNSYEEGEDIVLDLTHMEPSTGGFFRRYLLSNIRDKGARDAFPKSSILRFRLRADGSFTREPLLPQEPEDDIELPLIHPALFGRKHCVMWGVQFSTGGRSFASTALVKRNLCTGEKVTRFEEGRYVSEHVFVPRPGAEAEDDGALVGLVFDGAANETVAEVADARTLERLATMRVGLRVPFPVHATWAGKPGPRAPVFV
mmetsp:Transcript_27616/g.82348  ORF Transcript_27616/g.82348 Transcript_27616/m.82348 type:complete len:535 (+) Transcript_27616:96-1700(+)